MRAVDTTLSALTPEGIEWTLYPAGLYARAVAYAIDCALQWTLVLTAYILTSLLGEPVGMWFVLLLMFVTEWFYHVICEVFFNGQSLGKKLAGLRVVQSDGSPVTAVSSFLRNTMRFADTFIMLYHIALFTLCGTSGFKRIGDIVGGTLVVYASASRFVFAPAKTALPSGIIPPARKWTHEEKQAALDFTARYSMLGRARADEIAAPWVESLGISPRGGIAPSEYVLAFAKLWTGE